MQNQEKDGAQDRSDGPDESSVRVLGSSCAFSCVHLGIGMIKLAGEFVRVNQALADMYGLSQEELLQTGPLDLSPEI